MRKLVDFRYRLIGTQACDIMRGDFTGQFFSKIPGKGKESVPWQECDAVAGSKMPMYWQTPYVGPERFLRNVQNVLLPLGNDGVNVTMIFKMISFERGPSSV